MADLVEASAQPGNSRRPHSGTAGASWPAGLGAAGLCPGLLGARRGHHAWPAGDDSVRRPGGPNGWDF